MATPATTTTTTLMVVRTLMMLLVVMLMLMLLLPRTMMMLLSTATAVVVLPIVAHASATPTSTSQMMVGGAEDRVVQLVVDRVRVANAIRVRLMQMLRMGRLVMVVPMVTLVLLVRLLLLLDTVLLQGMRLHWLLMVVEILAIVAPAGTTDSHIAQPVLERRYFARIVTTVRHRPVVAAEMVPHLLLIVESTTTATTRLYTALGGGKTMVHQGRLWLVHVHLLLVVLVRVGLLLLLPTTRLGHEFLRGRGQIEQLWRSNRLEVPGLRTPAPGIAMLLHAPNCTTDGCS